MSTLFHNILRAAASAMEIPVVIWWLAELLGERRHMNASLPRLLEAMRSGERPLPDCIAALRESLAVNLLEKRGEVYYDARTGTYYIVPNAAGN